MGKGKRYADDKAASKVVRSGSGGGNVDLNDKEKVLYVLLNKEVTEGPEEVLGEDEAVVDIYESEIAVKVSTLGLRANGWGRRTFELACAVVKIK